MARFVVRMTSHPEEDLKRNWSSYILGAFAEWCNGPAGSVKHHEDSFIRFKVGNRALEQLGFSQADFVDFESVIAAADPDLDGSLIEELEAAREEFAQYEWGWHPAHNGWVVIHYHGLGAFKLPAETMEEAVEMVANDPQAEVKYTPFVPDAGDGHFYAEEVVRYAEARPGWWVFELRD